MSKKPKDDQKVISDARGNPYPQPNHWIVQSLDEWHAPCVGYYTVQRWDDGFNIGFGLTAARYATHYNPVLVVRVHKGKKIKAPEWWGLVQ